MAGVEENREVWTTTWDWADQGDEWSSWWGDTNAMWYGAVLPRVHAFIPTGTILEIGPGHGRWTQYLRRACQRLVIVDLAENCIEHCKERFGEDTNIEYLVNDGRSLQMVADHSVDFAFSFDVLVHAEADVLDGYVRQLADKLTPNGVGFFHHSNLGSYGPVSAAARRTPQRFLRPLVRRGVLVDVFAWRAESVTADTFATLCERAGLSCVAQERISWESGHYLIDTLSVFTPRGSVWDRPRQAVRNPLFRWEARRMASMYARSSFPSR